jgi:hypothetical protein
VFTEGDSVGHLFVSAPLPPDPEAISWIKRNDESLKVLFGALAVIAAFTSARYAIKSITQQLNTQKIVANHTLLTKSYDMINSSPELLIILGTSKEKLASDGISVEEFVFILNHFNAGTVYYQITGEKKVKLTEVRKNFLKNDKVQFVWANYLNGKFFNIGPWSKAVDEYIDSLRKKGGLG